MSDETAAPAASEAPATEVTSVSNDPAVSKIAALKARRRANADTTAKPPEPAKPAAPPTTTATPAAPPKVEAEVNISDAELNQFTSTQKEIRRLQAQNKQLEADAKEAATLKKYRELKAAGKYQEAADLIEFDAEALTQQHLKASIPMTPERQELEALRKDLEGVKTTTEEQKKRDAEQTEANRAAAKAEHSKTVIGFVTENKAEFKYLSTNPAWATKAYETALDTFYTIPANERPKTAEQSAAFVRAFLDEAEAEHALTAKLYTGEANHLTVQENDRKSPAANGNRQSENRNHNTKLTFDEVRARRRKSASR